MSILKLRDENGVFQDVPVLKGTDATINGQSTVQIQAGQNVNIDQSNGILTISAIGGGGSSTDNVVVLDLEKLCSLTTESTPEEITTALGGEENKQNVIKAYENNNNIVLKGFFRKDLGSSVAINSFYANISVEIITSFAGGANYILCLIFNDSHFKNVIKFKLNETIDDIISFEEREQYNIPTNISDLENDSNFISGVASPTNLGGIKVGNNLTIDSDGTLNAVGGGGEGGTTDYTALSNKPQINNVTLSGNKSLDDLGIQQKGTYLETESDPTVPAHVKTITSTQITNWDNEVGAKSIANGKQDILTPGSNINISNGVISATDTTNYSLLTNKPKINNKELSGNMTLDTLGIQEKGTYLESESDPTVPSYVKSITSDQITKWDNEVGGKAIAANKQDALTPGTNISIENNVISAVDTNTTNYTELTNKPKINSVELSGNKTLDDLSIQHKLTAGTNIDITGNTISTSVQNGKDGHTPVKGVDYFTAEEQEQFKNDIINSIGAVQTYRTGNGIPANSLGQDGDLYFDMQ